MSSRLRRSVLTLLPKNRRQQCYTFSSYYYILRRQYSSKDEFIVKSPYPDISIPKMPLHQYVWKDIDQWGDKVALECSVTKKRYTYLEARKLSQTVTSVFQNNFMLNRGDCVALVSPNIPEYPLFFTAASEGGLILTTANFIYTPDEIAKQLHDSNAKVIITVPSKFDIVKDAARKLGRDLPILVIKDNEQAEIPRGGICLESLIQSASPDVKPVDIQFDDSIALPYSSGTTGLPKGVQLTHANIVSNLEMLDSPHIRLLLRTTASQQDVVLGLLPMYHIYGMVIVGLATLAGGGKLVTFPKFEPNQFIEGLVQHKIELLYLVPPLVLFLADHPSVKPEHLKYVRQTNTGAAPIGKADMMRLLKKAPHVQQFQGYGMTETSPLVLMTNKQRRDKASCGVPCPNTWTKIVDIESGKTLPSGKVGELYVKGPQVMKGYLNRQDANEDIFRDGWLRTGDMAYYDEDGDFYIVDRLKELIKVKGLQVPPAELEALLREHPEILEAAVIGVPDARSGELPRAFVVKVPESSLTEEEVAEFVARRVSQHKRLAGGVVFLPSLPKSAAGKLLRKELKNIPTGAS